MNLYEQDEGYRNAIASLVVENSDEYKALGEDTGTAFGEGFLSGFSKLWGSMFDNMYSDGNSLLGTYPTKEEALQIKQLADEHIDAGDFDEWALQFQKRRRNSSE